MTYLKSYLKTAFEMTKFIGGAYLIGEIFFRDNVPVADVLGLYVVIIALAGPIFLTLSRKQKC